MRSGEICWLIVSDVTSKGNLGRFIKIQPNAMRKLKSKAAEREVPLHQILEGLLDTSLSTRGRLFPHLTVGRVVKDYARLRYIIPHSMALCSTPHASGSSPSASVQVYQSIKE